MNRRKDTIRRHTKGMCAIVSLCLLLVGCMETEVSPFPPETTGVVPFNLSAETALIGTGKVRVIVFSGLSESGVKTFRYNRLFTDLKFNLPVVPAEYNDIYTVIDEESDLSGITTQAALLSVKVSRNLPADANAVKQRFYQYRNVYARTDGSGEIIYEGNDIGQTGLGMSKYTMAKIALAFDLNPVVDGVTLKFKEVELADLPTYSYLIPKVYDSPVYTNKTISLGTSTVPGRYKYSTSVLVPEYLIPSGGKKVRLVVRAERYKAGVKQGISEYTTNVGNAISGGTDYSIERNKVYKFNFTGVTGLGQQVDDWKVAGSVADWDTKEVNTEISDVHGFFLQTEQIEGFQAFRLPRYVNFKATGPGAVWIDKPREINNENAVATNDFNVKVLWDDDSHRSGKLALRLGNWRTGGNFSVRIKMRANNIEKTLVVNCVGARYAQSSLTDNLAWPAAMGYTDEALDGFAGGIPDDELIRLYSQNDLPTGCAAYYENIENDPLTGKGCWRVATIREGLYYLTDKQIKGALWAYEVYYTAGYSYTSSTWAGFPDKNNLHHPADNFIPRGYRTVSKTVLCVQDDKLEKYYHVGVNMADHAGDVTFAEAQQFCLDLREDGKDDWRLPTQEEALHAMLNAGRQGIPNNLNADYYWLNTGKAASVAMPQGGDPPGGRANFRCVRNKW